MDHHPPIVETDTHVATLRGEDEAATCRFAQALAQQAPLGEALITLQGDLGAGKTTLVRYLLQALGVQGRIKSPTYAIVETYETQVGPAAHFDFYRFNDPQEWEDAGFRDIFASPGLKLVEWPQKAEGLLPAADLDIHITTGSDAVRTLNLQAATARGQALLQGVLLLWAKGGCA